MGLLLDKCNYHLYILFHIHNFLLVINIFYLASIDNYVKYNLYQPKSYFLYLLVFKKDLNKTYRFYLFQIMQLQQPENHIKYYQLLLFQIQSYQLLMFNLRTIKVYLLSLQNPIYSFDFYFKGILLLNFTQNRIK